jgi:chromosome segregation protein
VFLKTLQIKGFKSFADAATLTLEPGVTVVVGPNGSGKSNVVDAIGWVLGAQAPSAVRSQKMDDVIFAGSAKRPALGRAEVAITIDNSSGMLPIDFTEVTISRLLFRSGDSEYAINGVPCRLLDITDLLSDSGVGRQQHVIISQGNIDGVLNSRPEERRLIIEEAAGVLKFRRRKERAERRLQGTEQNLTRVQDLLREVRRQLRPLERQAEAARRHGDLVAELSALRLHVAGREILRLRGVLEQSTRRQQQLREDDGRLRAALADLDARLLAAEAQLAAMGGRDLGDSLVRYERLEERGRGLGALLVERVRGAERDLAASVDAAVVASLESEQASLRREAEEIAGERQVLERESDELLRDEAGLVDRRRGFEEVWGDGVVVPTGEAAAVRGEIAALTTAVERSEGDRSRLEARRSALGERAERLGSEHVSLLDEQAASTELEPSSATELETLRVATRRAADALAASESAATDAAADHSAWSARVEALTMALDEARDRAGATRLAGLDGVLGTLSELVEVDDGWEEPFEAAAAEALGAVVVSDVDAARRGLRSLVEGDHAGAVLALGAAAVEPDRPGVGVAIRDHVRPSTRAGSSAPGVARLLDALLARAVLVDGDWSAALQASTSDPTAVVVTRRGDRFGVAGWRLRAAGSGATGAALDEAVERAERSALARRDALAAVAAARAELDTARRSEQQAERDLEALRARARTIADALVRIERDRAEVDEESAALAAHADELVARAGRESERLAELNSRLPELEAAEAEIDEQARRMTSARDELESLAATVAARRTDLEVRAAGVEERRRYVESRRSQIDERLEHLQVESAAAADRRSELEARLVALRRLSGVVESLAGVVAANVAELREERRVQSEAARSASELLEGLRAERTAAESELESVRGRSQQLEVADAEARMRLEAATESLRADHDCGPDVAVEAECPPLPEGTTAPARVRELERELRVMGPINPLALQEFTELTERHEFLTGQLDDVRQSRRELAKVIRAVDEEIVSVFAAAFADVSENFTSLFETLFPGGQGRLTLTDPDNLLETGIEIEARPSGKNVRKLSLLSGGERSLTALAYLFAVFRSRPSPFYVMDEVEAALDDVNLHRFLDLVAEFRDSAQLLIVSHQKRTMEAADILYGVTMEPGGSTKVVSERAAAVLD